MCNQQVKLVLKTKFFYTVNVAVSILLETFTYAFPYLLKCYSAVGKTVVSLKVAFL